jgi:hypothetical protein
MDRKRDIPDPPSTWTEKGLSRKAWKQIYKIKDENIFPTNRTHDESINSSANNPEMTVSEVKTTAEWPNLDDENIK